MTFEYRSKPKKQDNITKEYKVAKKLGSIGKKSAKSINKNLTSTSKKIKTSFYRRDGKSKLSALTVVLASLIVFFIIGFVGINVLMSLVVGAGKEVLVPDLYDLHFDVARKNARELDLFVQQIELRHHDEIAQNRIISQSPEPHKMTKANRTIEVVVSMGPELVRVPYLDNITEQEAKLRLDNVGLILGERIYRYSDDVSKDRIIYSQPLADDYIPRQSKVKVFVSLGKLPDISDRHQRYRGVLDNIE